MASVFKRKGERSYTIAWHDAQGSRHERSSRTSDKKTAELIASRIRSQVALRREGFIDARQDRLASHVGRPMVEHVRYFVQHCLDAEQARVTLTEKARHLAWLLGETEWRMLLPESKRKEWAANECTKPKLRKEKPSKPERPIPISRKVGGPGWKLLADMTAESLERALGLLREAGLSARACNYKREVAVAFAGWCVKTGRLESNPLLLVQRLDASRDQRRVRRALSEDELAKLFAVAAKKGRQLWYMLAAMAGLRRSEIAGLTWADVDLDGGFLTISHGKAKRTDTLPLHPDLAAELRRVKPDLVLPSARVFAAEMTNQTRRGDFLAAGINLKDEAGVADLHSLRTTLGTRLGRAGVAPQIAQRIMRHTDYRVTLKHYTRLTLDDSAAALSRLAPIEAKTPDVEQLRKTGSDGQDAPSEQVRVPHEEGPHRGPQSGHESRRSEANGGEDWNDLEAPGFDRKPASDASLRDALPFGAMVHPARLELATTGSEDRYSIQLSYGCWMRGADPRDSA
jgi:integrase